MRKNSNAYLRDGYHLIEYLDTLKQEEVADFTIDILKRDLEDVLKIISDYKGTTYEQLEFAMGILIDELGHFTTLQEGRKMFKNDISEISKDIRFILAEILKNTARRYYLMIDKEE